MAIGLASGKILIYDVREMKVAQELEPPQNGSEINKLVFSNKGVYLAATWKTLGICRVFSLHKECAYADLDHKDNMVTSVAFDKFGGYLMTAAGNELSIFNYKNWKKPVGLFQLGTPIQSAMFDMTCNKIFVGCATVGAIKMLSL